MSLITYDRPGDADGNPLPYPLKFENGNQPRALFRPGEWVVHAHYNGRGMIIACTEEQCTVLWSIEPSSSFSHIAFPAIRRVFPTTIANQIVSIQPMSAPSGLIFYMDYTYGSERDKLCNTGPWVNRMFHRACRWVVNQKTRLRWQPLRFWLRSLFGKKLSSGSNVVDEHKKMLLEKWSTNLAKMSHDPRE